MFKDDLTIELVGNRSEIKTGDAIRGKVIVAVAKPRQCQALKLLLEYVVDGKIYGALTTVSELELPGGELEPGRFYEYPFEFAPVFGPLSYQGEYFSITWTLEVTARVSGPNISKTTTLSLVPGDDRSCITLGPEFKKPYPPNFGDVRLGIALGLITILAFFVPTVILIKPGLIHFFSQQGPIPKELLDRMGASLFFILFGGLIAYFVIKKLLSYLKIGPIKYEIDSQELEAGEQVSGAITFTPVKNVRILKLTAALVGEEESYSPSRGGSGLRFVHQLFRSEKILGENLTLSRNMPHRRQFMFEIPDDAVPSFMSNRHNIKWRIEIHAELTGRLSWSHEINLLVRP